MAGYPVFKLRRSQVLPTRLREDDAVDDPNAPTINRDHCVMSRDRGRILFRLREDELVVANTGRPFTPRGLVAVVYGWDSTKPDDVVQNRDFRDEGDARAEVERLYKQKQIALSIEDQRRSEANQQGQTAQSYAGRAIIELLQNAVDANRARPIGYKGIGFRSILTLSDSPEIRSGPLKVCWSPEVASRALGGVHVPSSSVLAFPEWRDETGNDLPDYNTVIRLPLTLEGRERLAEEWNTMTRDSSLVVFVDGIHEIRWESQDTVRLWQRESSGDVVSVTETVGDVLGTPSQWHLCRSNDGHAAIAVPVDGEGRFSRRSVSPATLRCYFPTDEPNPFPNVLVHASFPLATDRKRIDLEDKNATARIAAAAEAMAAAVAHRTDAEVLDILEHSEIPTVHAVRVEARLCESVRHAIRAHPIFHRRSCPAYDELPQSWRNKSRLENWEKFKAALSEHRSGGLSGLSLLPVGVENPAREATLLWINSAATLKAEDLRSLPWAPIEGGQATDAVAVPLFESPHGDDALPSIPDGLRLHFLARAFQAAITDLLGVNVSRDLLQKMLGVLKFQLIEVVEKAVLPALRDGQQAPDLISFLLGLWCHARDDAGKAFDWEDLRRAELTRRCKVDCLNGDPRPAVDVYAGSEWTGSPFLDRAYGSREDRGFLHSPPPDESVRANLEGFYRWLGVGWFPKVLPLVVEARKQGTRLGLPWSNMRFAGLDPEPVKWAKYCATAWATRFHSSRFLERKPRLRTNWTLDGGSGVLQQPGAFEVICSGWSEYSRYGSAVCYWSRNLSQDYDDEARESDSYLIWLLKTTSWIPTETPDRPSAPCDTFLPGEVAQSRNIRGWVQALNLDVPEDMASKLGLRRNWSEIEHADWVRWLTSALGRKPQENIEDREPIRRLYSSLLDRAKPAPNNSPPFAGAKFWWVERLADCEHWKFDLFGNSRASYLDRPEFEGLFLKGVFVFPVRLDGKESRAAALIGVPPLSTRLKGVPDVSGESDVEELHDLLRERAAYIVAYLGMERNEQGREKLRSAVLSVRVSDVDDLNVRWTLDGRPIDGGVSSRDSFVASNDGGWRVYLMSRLRLYDPKWAMECVAEAVLLACGFRPTERIANLCDILMCDTARLGEKLTKLGVAPETIEELRKALVSPEPPPVLPSVPPVPPSVPPVPPSVPPVLPSVPPVLPSVPPVPPSVPLVPPPLPPQRPHVDAFNAQKWLRSELENRLRCDGWDIGEEVVVGPSRIDIVLTRLHERHLIEVKQIERGTIYWREEQIRAAQISANCYILALVTSPEEGVHEVRWVWSPLVDFGGLERRVRWYWKERPAGCGFDENWKPLAVERPAVQPDVFKAEIQLTPAFLAGLETGVDALMHRITSRENTE
jgi:hypothetical protein